MFMAIFISIDSRYHKKSRLSHCYCILTNDASISLFRYNIDIILMKYHDINIDTIFNQ